MAAINADPEVMRWIGSGTTRSVEQTRTAIKLWEREWDESGFGLFAVEMRDTGELAGFVGLSISVATPFVKKCQGLRDTRKQLRASPCP